MGIFLLFVHIIVCVVLIMVVLLQSGKAADLAGAFGGGGSQTALGSRGAATFLTKATTTCAILFMLTSLGLALLGSKRDASVLESLPAEAATPAVPTNAAGEQGVPPAGEPAAAVPAAAGEAPEAATDAAAADADAENAAAEGDGQQD